MVARPCKSPLRRNSWVHRSIAVVKIAPTRHKVRGPADGTTGDLLSTICQLLSQGRSAPRSMERHYGRSVVLVRMTRRKLAYTSHGGMRPRPGKHRVNIL